jgi:hypothetical protein
VIVSGEEEKIIIAFGFNEANACLSNVVYEYNISKNKLSILFEGAAEDKPSNKYSIQMFQVQELDVLSPPTTVISLCLEAKMIITGSTISGVLA